MISKRVVRASVFFAFVVAAWEAGARLRLWNPVLLPPPSEIGAYLARAIVDGTIPGATLVTFRRLLSGYAIGLAAGLPLGFLTARFRMASDTLGLVALGLQTLPSVCWVPLAIVWIGLSEATMLFVVVMGTLWSIVLATEHGVRSVPPIYLRAARTMGARGLSLVVRVLLPASLPFVMSGMKQGWAFAWRSLMAAEIFVAVAGAKGLGLLLDHGRSMYSYDQVIGVMLVILFVGLVVDRLLFSPLERFLHRRWGTDRT